MPIYSISPENEKFMLPDDKETENEISKIRKLCDVERNNGKEIVCRESTLQR